MDIIKLQCVCLVQGELRICENENTYEVSIYFSVVLMMLATVVPTSTVSNNTKLSQIVEVM